MTKPANEPMANDPGTTRRTFIKTAIAAGASLSAVSKLAGAQLAGSATGAQTPPGGPEDKFAAPTAREAFRDVRIAYIGTGGIGAHHLEETTKFVVQCPCYCDADSDRFAPAAQAFPQAKGYQDYREMFDKEHRNFDAVMVGTPDHHHYPATIIAMQLGKHVYTQKPLTHTPWEARQLTEAARKYKVVTQMGNQGHAMEGWRLVYEWVHSGVLGHITEVHTWTDRPVWPQGMERAEGEDPVPGHVNWDAWLGPAPERPFKNEVYHPFKWRGWWDFGAGALGDMACHCMDGVFWALDTGYPTAVEPVTMTPMNQETFPTASMVKWEFPAKGRRRAFTAYWYDGGLKPRRPAELEAGRRLADNGNLFIGTKASLLVSGAYGDSPRVFPESKMKEIGKPPMLLQRSPGHFAEWLMAVVGDKPIDYPKSNFAYAGPMSEAILIGNIALRLGRRLEWDGPNLRFTNAPEANQYVSKEYRSGWKF